MKKLEWAELWAAMDADPAMWQETTESMYWDMLGAVPPQDQARGGFLVGEPNDHNARNEAVYACFVEVWEGYKARYMTQREFNQWKTIRV